MVPTAMTSATRRFPAELRDTAAEKREEMLDAVSMCSDELMEAMLEDTVTEEMIHRAVRKVRSPWSLFPSSWDPPTRTRASSRCSMRWCLPSEPDRSHDTALDLDIDEQAVVLKADRACPRSFSASSSRTASTVSSPTSAFTGKAQKGDELMNTRSRKKFKVGRLVRMHASSMEDIAEAVVAT